MNRRPADLRAHWSVVVADEHGPEWAPSTDRSEPASPVQYCRLGSSRTLLQKTLDRGARLSSPAKLLVTVREEYRGLWESSLWFVKPTQRLVCDHRLSSWLTTAAALLRIASETPSAVVALLPARCFVAHDEVLNAALDRALFELPSVPEGVVALGMMDFDAGLDEDYLVPDSQCADPTVPVLGVARRPISWVANHLRDNGAMVASGIMIGYAGAFAAHISRIWPGVSARLLRLVAAASLAGTETTVPSSLQRGAPVLMLSTLRWYAPSLAQRVLRVPHCGWSGLRTAQAVARVCAFVTRSANPPSRSRSDDLVAAL